MSAKQGHNPRRGGDGKTATLEVFNRAKSGILIYKVDALTGNGIYGVTFLLYDGGNNPIGQYTTDQSGRVLINDGLTAGRYYLRELNAAPGYVLDETLRILCFDLYDLGENLKPLGLLVMLDCILNRVIRNRAAGRYTHIYIDEIYLFFAYQYSASFLYKCWKRFRKYGGIVTGITQNVEECLRSDTARLMFANSEFLLLFNQAATDRAELAKLLNISETQMSHITNAEAGHGLLKVGGSMIPFKNDFPRHTELFKLMSTSPGGGNAAHH